MKKLCINCKHFKMNHGDLECGRTNPKTGMPIGIPTNCETQRSNRIAGWLMGTDLCGIKGKYFESKEGE